MANKIDKSRLSVSNSELVEGLAQTALSTMEYLTKLDAKQDQREINALTTPVVAGIKALDKGWDPEIAKSVKLSLDALELGSVNKDFDPVYQETLGQLHETSLNAFKIYEANEQMLSTAEDEITSVYDDLKVLKTRSPGSLDIVQATAENKSINIQNVKEKAIRTNLARIGSLAKESAAIQAAIDIDANQNAEGLQIKLDDFNAQMVAEKLGFVKSKEDDLEIEGVDYFLPEDMQLSLETYDEAKTWLNKWEALNVNKQETALAQQIKHEETLVFDYVKQLGMSADSEEQDAFKLIAASLFGTKEDVKEGNRILDELDISNPKLAKKVRAYGNELASTFATGKYEQDFDVLKNLFNADLLDNREEGSDQLTEEQEVARSEAANKIVANIKIANDRIDALDKDYVSNIAANVEALDKTPGRSDVLKRQVSQSIQGLVNKEWFITGYDIPGPDPDHPLMKFRDATTANEKYKQLKKLTERYLDLDGNRLKPGEISQLLNNDAKETEVFISLLQAFQSLMVLSPVKTLKIGE